MKGMFSLSEDDLSDQAGMQILRQEGIDEDMLTQCWSNDDFVQNFSVFIAEHLETNKCIY